MTRDQIITQALADGRLRPSQIDWAVTAPIGQLLGEIIANEPHAQTGVFRAQVRTDEATTMLGERQRPRLRAEDVSPKEEEAPTNFDDEAFQLEEVARLSGHSSDALFENMARNARREADR